MKNKPIYMCEWSWLFHDVMLRKDDDRLVRKLVLQSIANARPSTPSVLDAGCGDGRTVSLVESMGVATFGFDLSELAVKLAAKNSPSAVLWCQDFCQPVANGPFDLCFVLNRSLNHVSSKEMQFEAIRNLLAAVKNGGTLVLDLMNPSPEANKIKTTTRTRSKVAPVIGHMQIVEEYDRDVDNQILSVNRKFVVNDDVVEKDDFKMRWFDATELMRHLTECGVAKKNVRLFGDYDESPLKSNSGQIVAVVCP